MMKKLLVLGIVAAIIQTPVVWANQGGTSTAAFLRIGQGARAEGMGGAFTAVSNDAHATFWNPAGLAQVTKREVVFEHMNFIEDIRGQHAAVVMPLNQFNGTLGFSGSFLDLGSIDRTDASGVAASGETDISAYQAALSYGQAIGSSFALGGGVRFLSQDLAGDTGSGFAADLGALLFVIPEKFGLGASVSNLGPQIKTGTKNENLPTTFRGGAVYYAIPQKLLFAADAEKERDTDVTFHAGGEYVYQNRYILRLGYQDNHEANGGLSVGGGFIWRPSTSEGGKDFFGRQDKVYENDRQITLRLDYAYVDLGEFNATHRFGISLIF